MRGLRRAWSWIDTTFDCSFGIGGDTRDTVVINSKYDFGSESMGRTSKVAVQCVDRGACMDIVSDSASYFSTNHLCPLTFVLSLIDTRSLKSSQQCHRSLRRK